MTHEREAMPMIKTHILGEAAVGTIGPEARIAAGEITQEKVDELAVRIADGEFYDAVSDELGPNAAGGTFTLVVADALTTGRFRAQGVNAKEHASALYSWLIENKNDAESRKIIPRVCIDGRMPVPGSAANTSVVGGHDDENSAAGCGAQAKLGPIIEYIANNGSALRDFAASKGVEVDELTHNLLVANAARLLSEDYVSSGEELRAAYAETAGEDSVVTLAGPHMEVVAGINTDKSLTLNRQKVANEYGPAYESFNADVGVFPEAAAIISLTEEEAHQKSIAMLYFNEAAALVLAHKSLRI